MSSRAIATLRAQLRSIGAELDADEYTLNADAPDGYVWAATGCRTVCIPWASNSQTWASVAIRAAMPILRAGVVKVTDPEDLARHQWETGEDTWGAAPDAPDQIAWGSR
jgi:hypothetical protein